MINIDYFFEYDENEQAKELYAQFGLCVYYFQVLEHQLIDMILLNAKENNILLSSSDYDTIFFAYSDKSMGTLTRKVYELYDLSQSDKIEIENIREKRNYFVHNYFKNCSADLYNTKKRAKMLSEFIETIEQIKNIESKLKTLCNKSLHKVGITKKTLDLLLQDIKNDKFETDNLIFGKQNLKQVSNPKKF